MNLDLNQRCTIKELVELKDKISDYIYNHSDGFLYICNVRYYGRNWKEHVHNTYTLQELCYRYNGDDGIVDVYSTNPNLAHIQNYGDVMYIVSQDDYDEWKKYTYLTNSIPQREKELDEWDNRDNVPFSNRPFFAPYYSREDIAESKKELDEFDMSFVPPKSYRDKE
jgi:hypothetical protein